MGFSRDACARIKATGAGAGPPAALQCLPGAGCGRPPRLRWLPAAWVGMLALAGSCHDGEAARRLNGLQAIHAVFVGARQQNAHQPGPQWSAADSEQHVDGGAEKCRGGSTDIPTWGLGPAVNQQVVVRGAKLTILA